MIYKFIDNNGAEITVNSLSSLQALVDSETVKENTKVKAGLRGKWATANDIPDLKFEEEKVEEPPKEEIDIIDMITKEEAPSSEISEKPKEEPKVRPTTTTDIIKEEKISKTEPEPETTTDEVISKTEDDKFEEEYADEKMEDINFFQSIKICFQKFFIFKGRASRSEYWWFYLFYIVTGTIPSFIPNELVMAFGWIMIILLLIPSLAVIVRRLHDINKSGWFILVSLIPLVGAIILLVKTIEKGTLGKNRFGEYPLKFKKGK
jgi:uncharacterized membrane protein YhaH (DUF805 family)